MTTPEEHPRVRPSLWAVMLILGGLGLLFFGHKHEWFLAALESGTLHNLTYFLAWAMVGSAYSILASFLWIRCLRRPGRFRIVLSFLLPLALMTAASQVAAREVMHTLGVPIVAIGWNPDSQEFLVNFVSTNSPVADAHIRGDLQAIVSVEGLWWIPSEKVTSQPLLVSEVEEFAVGTPDLRGRRPGTYGPLRRVWTEPDFRAMRLPWKPSSVEPNWAYVVWVNVAFVNRQGKRVGRESAHRGELQHLVGVWDPTDPRLARLWAFMVAGRDWIRNRGRTWAPFPVEPTMPHSRDRATQD